MPSKQNSHRSSVLGGIKSFFGTARDGAPSSAGLTRASRRDRLDRQMNSAGSGTVGNEPLLPPELFERIVYHLRDDAAMLDLCCYLNSAFRVFAQRLIFREIILDDRSHPDRPISPSQRFLQVRSWAPHIPTYVHSMVVIGDPSSQRRRSWILNDQHLLEVTSILPNLERLSIRSLAKKRNAIRWIDLSPIVRSAVIDTVQNRRSLKELEFEGLEQLPLTLFDWCPRLEKLSLGHFSPADAPHLSTADVPRVPPDVTRNRRRLKHLAVQHTTDRVLSVIDWLLSPHCPFSLSRLRRLDYGFCEEQEAGTLNPLLGLCQNSLEYLALTPPSHASTVFANRNIRQQPYTPRAFDLSFESFVNLRTFSFSIHVRKVQANGPQYPAGFTSSLPLLVKLLSSLPQGNRLRHLGINLKVIRVENTVLEQLDWAELVAFLRSNKMQRLRLLRIDTKGDEMLPKTRMVEILRANADLLGLIWANMLVLT